MTCFIFLLIFFSHCHAWTNASPIEYLASHDSVSFALETDEVAAGKRFKIDYEANDEGAGLREISFQFRNETGNTFNVYDYEQDGMAIQKIYESQMQGSYTLDRISLRDDAYRSNSIEYKADGTTQIWDSINNTWIYGEHDFDFTIETVNITDPIPINE